MLAPPQHKANYIYIYIYIYMAGDLDQLFGLYNFTTPTHNTTFICGGGETNDLLDQFGCYSTINNNLNDLQCLGNYSTNNNYAYYPSNDHLLANPNYMFSLPDDDDDRLFEPYYPPSKRQKVICCGSDDQYAGYSCCPALNNSPNSTTSSCYHQSSRALMINADEGSGKKAMAPMKVDDQGMSAQSVAARQRRRRITEKTRELGELVPGGNKMNTAEMFHSAFKYIKFLQAQVGVLHFMASIHQDNRNGDEQLQVLLASPIIQEKLYSAEKCLVPKQLIETSNAKDQHEIITNKLISKDSTDDLLMQQTDEEKLG
ncbi:hypothetical protein Scep_013300 [Stephania cephalantha]|uniref:BHLH domain-containing protein n=1 Tax=Stephania cephalantha TaxID=152367 RepID=A0AAP0JJ34_9MAGN